MLTATQSDTEKRATVQLFGCRIDCIRTPEAVAGVFEMVSNPTDRCRFVVTPNVQHVVMLQNHDGLKQAYDDAALVLADGMPVVVASRYLGKALPERVNGTNFVLALFDAAANHGGLRVFLLGAGPGVAEQAIPRIAETWPDVEVVGTYSPPFGFEHNPEENATILERIAAAQPDIVLVGLGAPKQELWTHRHQQQIAAPVALCIGATIDFLAGNKRRAPRWMQDAGLEWLHRVATEPRRLVGRYVRDAWHFPQLVLKEWKSQSAKV